MTLHNTSHYLLPSFIISSLQSIMIINSSTSRFLKSLQTATQEIRNVSIFSPIHIKLCFSLLYSSTQFSLTTVFALYTKPCSISALKNSTNYLYN